MDYKTFRLRLRDALCQEMGEEVSITLQQVQKNNGVCCQGISIRKKEERIAPVIYLDPYYEAFEGGLEFYKVVREIRRQYLLGNVSDISMEAFGDYQKVKDQIYYKLINYEKNKELLERIPHYPYMDLAVAFYYRLEETSLSGATVLIHNNNLEHWKITKEELFQSANRNTPEKLPYTFRGMGEMIQALLEEDSDWEAPADDSDMADDGMFILTNEDKYYGASCLLYPELLNHIGRILKASFYILPSSIHECILIPDSGEYSPSELSAMVREVNASHAEPTEILSDHVYYFDRRERKIAALI